MRARRAGVAELLRWPAAECALHRNALALDVAGCSLEEFGLVFKVSVFESPGRFGEVSRVVQHTRFGSLGVDMSRDVLPLPVPVASRDEARLLQALKAGTSLRDALKDFPCSIKRIGVSVWLFLLVVSLNYLATGFSHVETSGVHSAAIVEIIAAQLSSLNYLTCRVEAFLEDGGHSRLPRVDWSNRF